MIQRSGPAADGLILFQGSGIKRTILRRSLFE